MVLTILFRTISLISTLSIFLHRHHLATRILLLHRLNHAGLSLQAFHYPFLATYPSLFTLHSVLERSATAEKSAARDFTGIKDLKVVNTIEEIVGDEEVELVIVSVPNLWHYEYAKKALEAGKHGEPVHHLHWDRSRMLSNESILCHSTFHLRCLIASHLIPLTSPSFVPFLLSTVLIEKPLTPTSAQANELVDLAHSKGLILAPFQNRRWDSDFLGVRDVLERGEVSILLILHRDWGETHSGLFGLSSGTQLGQLTQFTSQFDRFRPDPVPNTWKEAPGAMNESIYNLGSHVIDQVSGGSNELKNDQTGCGRG